LGAIRDAGSWSDGVVDVVSRAMIDDRAALWREEQVEFLVLLVKSTLRAYANVERVDRDPVTLDTRRYRSDIGTKRLHRARRLTARRSYVPFDTRQ
jgi:hypothetical protein